MSVRSALRVGDIVLRARGGSIVLQDVARPPRPVFVLGRGGHGANVTVNRSDFQTSDTMLEVIAGRGGDSGILMLEADVITGVPSVEEIGTEVEPLAGGAGGDGGYVMWHNSNRPLFSGVGSITTTYPLEEIVFRGGGRR